MDIKEKISQLQNHLRAENFKFVIDECNKLINKYPNNSFYYNLCGLALQASKNIQISIEYFKKSIDLDNYNIAARNNLANSYKAIGNYSLSEKYYQSVLKINPNYIQTLNNFANLKSALNDYDLSIDYLEKALKIDQNNAIILYNLADSYKSIGNFQKAKKIYEKTISKYPQHTASHLNLSSINIYNSNSNHFKQMLTLIEDKKLKPKNIIDLSFAIGKAYEDLKNYEKSFLYYKKGNLLKKEIINYDIKQDKELFNSIIESFKDIDLNKKINIKNKKKVIFICGMPRSGTTLVEQIISSHPNVSGEGELSYLQNTASKNFLKNNFFQKNQLEEALQFNLNIINKEYFEMIKYHNISTDYITDKTPENFRWIGLMKLFFPNCKIIHCSRKPKDNCLSLYKNYFPAPKMHWAFNEEDIGNYFNLYKELMNFWKFKISDFIYEANYEKIVGNQEEEIKKIIRFCDLKWSETCLNFHKNTKTPIKTVSFVQARKPIYKSSVNSNSNYEKHLDKMFSIIKAN